MELVRMLYDGALDAVRAARGHLAAGRIPERGRSVAKAVEIIAELSRSLNHERGGELSVRLADLYDYMQRILLDANFRQADDGLRETESLLQVLGDAWKQVTPSASTPSASAAPAWCPAPDNAPRAAQSWSA
jgi:flagellar protein FliS